jgi:hypothetical protein
MGWSSTCDWLRFWRHCLDACDVSRRAPSRTGLSRSSKRLACPPVMIGVATHDRKKIYWLKKVGHDVPDCHVGQTASSRRTTRRKATGTVSVRAFQVGQTRHIPADRCCNRSREGFQLGTSETGTDNPPALGSCLTASARITSPFYPPDRGTHQRRSWSLYGVLDSDRVQRCRRKVAGRVGTRPSRWGTTGTSRPSDVVAKGGGIVEPLQPVVVS